ncbi:hypothetical protein BDV96DRAFT_266715 [Lophiotrema nucula]|uniref:DUF3638 domain-containing protein n=1 Tax=Lophiotrema nucula TaxID=690887 RepID=A0A6A5ZNK7_9PLEO|nr:hypothetical protein BDV96DRAFT_266715 [Lophiotrema nucula]
MSDYLRNTREAELPAGAGRPTSTGEKGRQDIRRRERHLFSRSSDRLDGQLPCRPRRANEDIGLAEFERWVEEHLPYWTKQHSRDERSCGSLARALSHYSKAAFGAYHDNPNARSVMLLTVLDLWVACDQIACRILPLLQQYDPEIPLESLRFLLLPRKSQMVRLRNIEAYVTARRPQGEPQPSIYRAFGDEASFAVQFVDRSPHHQNLLQEIVRKAESNRQATLNEFRALKEKYRTLMERYDQLKCHTKDYVNPEGQLQPQHVFPCMRCNSEMKASRLQMEIFEWPLPSQNSKAKAVIFELDIPDVFAQWRDVSFYVLRNIFGLPYQKQSLPVASYGLNYFSELAPYLDYKKHDTQRIIPLSSIKPHTGTHRSKRAIPSLAEDEVCVTNGLRFAYFDGKQLVRIIVGKPQNKQTLHLLRSKLGGLLGRRIYQLLFSRATSLDESQVATIRGVIQECIEKRGILLAQPEHILAFKLMGIEYLLKDNNMIGRQLLEIQALLDDKVVDIFDEADENFCPRFELIFHWAARHLLS